MHMQLKQMQLVGWQLTEVIFTAFLKFWFSVVMFNYHPGVELTNLKRFVKKPRCWRCQSQLQLRKSWGFMKLLMMMNFILVIWLTNKRHLALFPASTILTIANLWHTASRIWTCAEPKFRLCRMKLRSSDNHYITAPLFLPMFFGICWIKKNYQRNSSTLKHAVVNNNEF